MVLFLGWAGWRSLTAPVATKGDAAAIKFTVEPGVSGNQIGAELAREGLIESLDGWKIWTKLKQIGDSSGGFKACTYLVFSRRIFRRNCKQDLVGKNYADRIYYS